MRQPALPLTLIMLLANFAAAYEPGDQLVVVRPAEMKTITGSTFQLTSGTPLTVRGAVDDKLASDKLSFNRAGLDDAKVQAALADLNESIRLTPTSEAYTFRGFACKRLGDKDKAIADFDEAIRLNPNESLAWRVRGATYASKADYARTLADYTESIRVDPENPDSRHHRVVLRSACMDDKYRDGKQAIEDATKACDMSEWQNPLYVSGLAMAYAEAGNFDAAIKWQQRALDLS